MKADGQAGTASFVALVTSAVGVFLIACSSAQQASAPPVPSGDASPAAGASFAAFSGEEAFTGEDLSQTVTRYCVTCHNEAAGTADLGFDTLNVADPASHPAIWEDVVTKLRMGTMPPVGMPRPDEATYAAAATWIENELDEAWLANPNPGRIDAVHRLNRAEYNNAIRDLFALDIDLTADLPGDETADGAFDNTAALLQISTTNLNRYLTVARKVTRMAVGLPPQPTNHIERLHTTLIQQEHMGSRLPLGTRGGTAVDYYFPADGEYNLKVTMQRHYQEYFRGAGWPQWVDVRLDGELLKRFTYGGEAVAYRPATMPGAGEAGFAGSPEWEEYMTSSFNGADSDFEFVAPIEAGAHTLQVSFVRDRFEPEDILQPPQWTSAWTEQDDDERYLGYAQVLEVFITGPFEVRGIAEDTPSRRAIFVCEPEVEVEEEACAVEILTNMATRAYRRPATADDVAALMEFFREGRERGEGFDGGIQMALERMLVDPDFLFRVYRDPPVRLETASSATFLPSAPTDAYELTDLEVASRLSFFLWSSIPDEQLLELASQDGLVTPDRSVLKAQAERLLADPRTADALVEGFVSQWLNLRLLTQEFSFLPEDYPDGDGDLISAFPRETEEFIRYTLREDRSVVELLDADYSFINERLARHYGIPDVYGSHFRKVELPDLTKRGGILGHAGILALSSYPTRTSPVLRGKWLLDNILGTPPDPPPSNVDTTLEEDAVSETASIRERLAAHREDPVCSTCHQRIDPLGFSLEGYGVLGNYREFDERGNPVDNLGMWPSGREIDGMVGLRELLLDQREQFVSTVTEKLMAYALGRRVDYYDRPTIRKIVREAAENDYRWSSIIMGIVDSPAFLMRARADESAAD